jgi:hypothetical protein
VGCTPKGDVGGPLGGANYLYVEHRVLILKEIGAQDKIGLYILVGTLLGSNILLIAQ